MGLGASTTAGSVVLLLVIAGRFVAPLAIPRYPLPAVVFCLVLDAVDQTIFQQFPGIDLGGYQQYDKALDVYYLTIAYTSTLRNWSDPFAFGIARFLFYYRLIGVLTFELTEARWVLLVFPNTFEYFFIAYELVRTGWSPLRIGHRALLGLAAAIWVFIKLPQEWWLHIAELDVTDELKTRVFGVSVTQGWGDALGNRVWVLAVVLLVVAGLGVGLRVLLRHLPERDWPFGVDVDERARGGSVVDVPASMRARQQVFLRGPLIEKVALVSMVSVVFSNILPGVDATGTQIVSTVTVIVVANSVISHWLAGQGAHWRSTLAQFVAVAAINAVIVLALTLLPMRNGSSVHPGATLFFLLLLSLLVTLYDRYRMLRKLRRRQPPPRRHEPGAVAARPVQ